MTILNYESTTWLNMRLELKRVIAFLIDYLVVLVYIAVLTGSSLLFWTQFRGTVPSEPSPVIGQLIGFFTLTLPVFLYFYLLERGRHHATFGKRRMKIQVESLQGNASFLKRNLFKFLPWELAHTSVHWMMYYDRTDTVPGIWVWLIAVLPQLLVLFYLASIVISKGSSSMYDRFAGTRITTV